MDELVRTPPSPDGDEPRRMMRAGEMRTLSRSWSYPVLGGLSALAIASGLHIARVLGRGEALRWSTIVADILSAPGTYVYVMSATLVAMTAFGVVLGRWSERAHHLSVTDSLTGLFNRRHFAGLLFSETGRDRRHGRPTCVMCLDLDHLKAINDGMGHAAGDNALRVVAQVLSESVRGTDVVARFGGDEFAVLLPATTADQARRMGERILDQVMRRSGPASGTLGVSIGIAELNATSAPDDILVAADAALYWAKRTGGGRVAVAPPEVLRPSKGGEAPSR